MTTLECANKESERIKAIIQVGKVKGMISKCIHLINGNLSPLVYINGNLPIITQRFSLVLSLSIAEGWELIPCIEILIGKCMHKVRHVTTRMVFQY